MYVGKSCLTEPRRKLKFFPFNISPAADGSTPACHAPCDRDLTGGGLHARTRAVAFCLVASAVFRDSYVRVICERARVMHSHPFELYTWKRPSQFQDTSSSSAECLIIVRAFWVARSSSYPFCVL